MDELFCVAAFMASILGVIQTARESGLFQVRQELHREQVSRAMLDATVCQIAPPPTAKVFTLLGDVELH